MTTQGIQVQTCQSAEDIHPLWRDLHTSQQPRRAPLPFAAGQPPAPPMGMQLFGYEGRHFELRDAYTGRPVCKGALARECHRSEFLTILGGTAPALPDQSGRVQVEHGVYPPMVYGLQWVEIE